MIKSPALILMNDVVDSLLKYKAPKWSKIEITFDELDVYDSIVEDLGWLGVRPSGDGIELEYQCFNFRFKKSAPKN